ncbi:MAG: hypothetical protein V1781_02620 [Bacteroidota bacterium]
MNNSIVKNFGNLITDERDFMKNVFLELSCIYLRYLREVTGAE